MAARAGHRATGDGSPLPYSIKTADRLGTVAAFFQQFEKDQKERTKARNLRAAQRREESP
ncbi:MAG: hypothetical protein ABIS92_03235 [Polyangia bacterium]